MNGKKNRNRKMHNTKFNIYGNVHRYTIKPERAATKAMPIYDNDPVKMAKYHRDIILALADRYNGEELEQKLRELRFCSYATAREVINLSVISDVLHVEKKT